MSVANPEIEELEGVVKIKYDSDGVLALPEGTEYSRDQGEFETTSSNQVLAMERGTSIYLDGEADFEAYSLTDFLENISRVSDDTSIFDPNKTEIYQPEKSEDPNKTPIFPGSPDGSDTSVFDPSKYDIGDPEEYTRMMKENADTIILELADRGVKGKEATETLETLFESMNNTYDRFVYDEQESVDTNNEKSEEVSASSNPSEPSLEGEKRAVQQAEKRKLTEDEVEGKLSGIEEDLEQGSNERKLSDYVDARELLSEEGQAELDEFRSVKRQLEDGQAEISDF